MDGGREGRREREREGREGERGRGGRERGEGGKEGGSDGEWEVGSGKRLRRGRVEAETEEGVEECIQKTHMTEDIRQQKLNSTTPNREKTCTKEVQ